MTPAGVAAQYGDVTRVVRLASITKPLVAYAVLVAVEEGTLELDRPIPTIGGATAPLGLTLRHLLAHAAGYGFDTAKPIAPPGLRRMYSNTGFELIGTLLEEASDISTADYLNAAVFAPLGMANSALRGSPAKDVFSNVHDLVRFASELLAPTLIAADTFADFTSVQWPDMAGVVPGLGSFRPCPWGLGIEVRGHKSPHWTAPSNSPSTFGHFGGSGTFLWVDPLAASEPLALMCLTDREFDTWALSAWPQLSEAVLHSAAGSAGSTLLGMPARGR